MTTVTDDNDIESRVMDAARAVEAPSAATDVVDAGLVADVTVADGEAVVEADLSAFGAAEGQHLADAVLDAARGVDGVESAHLRQATVDEERTAGLGSVDNVVAVASAKGGVGKTTVATWLACALAADGDDVGVFDADLYGPNVPELLGAAGPVRSDADDHPLPITHAGIELMSAGLLSQGAPLAWRGAMAHEAISDLFRDTAWSGLDHLVVDLPPGTGDVVLTTLQEVPIDGVVIVTTPFHASVADTAKSVELFRDSGVPVLGAVVNMSGFTCPTCGDDHDLFPGDPPGEALDVEVLADLPFEHDLQGTPAPADVPEAFASVAEGVRERLADLAVDVGEHAADLRGVPGEERHERVRDAFEECAPGDEFAVVSDRDPTPVRAFLADVAGVDPESLAPFDVEEPTDGTWVARTRYPG